jgi:hypothetical protein
MMLQKRTLLRNKLFSGALARSCKACTRFMSVWLPLHSMSKSDPSMVTIWQKHRPLTCGPGDVNLLSCHGVTNASMHYEMPLAQHKNNCCVSWEVHKEVAPGNSAGQLPSSATRGTNLPTVLRPAHLPQHYNANVSCAEIEGTTRTGRIRNKIIHDIVGVQSIQEYVESSQLRLIWSR